ncbi:MAG: hypothetical protein AB1921_09765 [Thermodesulfobacteriota bacterium]
MSDLIKLLKHFFTRDIIYILGGSSIIISSLYVFKRLPYDKVNSYYALAAIGFAYIIGYAVQDGLSLVGVITTIPVTNPKSKCLLSLYKRFTNVTFPKKIELNTDIAIDRIIINEVEQEIGEYQRIITLKTLGTSAGPCIFISGIIIMLGVMFKKGGWSDDFDLLLSIFSILIGFTLFILGWIKGMQQAEYLNRRNTAPLSRENKAQYR